MTTDPTMQPASARTPDPEQVQAILAAHGVTAGDIIGELATVRDDAAAPDFDGSEQSHAQVRTLDVALKLWRMTPGLPEPSAV